MISINIIENRFSWLIMVNCGDNSPRIFSQDNAEETQCDGERPHTGVFVLQKKHLRILSDLVCDKLFFGKEPTLVDVILFSTLVLGILITKRMPRSPPLTAMDKVIPEMVGLAHRMKERAFYDWQDMYALLDVNAQFPKSVKRFKKPLKGIGSAEKFQKQAELAKLKADKKKKLANIKGKLVKKPEGKEETDHQQ